MKRCNNKAPQTIVAKTLEAKVIKVSESRIQQNSNLPVYIDIVYHVIWNTDQQNISTNKIRAQHDVINRDFNQKNQDNIKVPNSGDYNFFQFSGNPNINFLPINSSQLVNINRVFTNRTSFTGINDVLVNSGSPSLPNKINVYICNLNNILGEAFIQGINCTILYSSVGGPGDESNPSYALLGTLSPYNYGRTLTHELGHNFGLYHIFMDIYGGDVCSNQQLHADIPKQSNPNGTNAYLFKDSNGSWKGAGAYNTCGVKDQFMNFMDYVTDVNMVMFSNEQSKFMNNFVTTSGLLLLHSNPDPINLPNPPLNLEILENSITINSLVIKWDPPLNYSEIIE